MAEPTAAALRVELGGTIIAQTRRAVRTLETSDPSSYYITPEDLVPGVLMPTEDSRFCERKGHAATST